MLRHPTLATLEALKLTGMATALTEQLEMPEIQRLSFEERLGLLVDRERTTQENRRLIRRLAQARLPGSATLEDLDYRHPRGLEKSMIASLATGQWVRSHDNVLMVGPTGVGKTYLACALAQMACRLGFSALYLRLPRFFRDLAIAKGDGRMGDCSGVSPRRTSWSWMIGGWPPCPTSTAAISWNCSMIGTGVGPPSWPVNSRSTTGTRRSASRRWLTPFLTGLCTTPIRSRSKESPCANGW